MATRRRSAAEIRSTEKRRRDSVNAERRRQGNRACTDDESIPKNENQMMPHTGTNAADLYKQGGTRRQRRQGQSNHAYRGGKVIEL